MIRVRNSYLEAFRRCIQTEYGREEELAASIRGTPSHPNWMMQAGTAWHKVLTDDTLDLYRGLSPEHAPGRVAAGEYSFAMQDALAARKLVGPGLHEVPGSLLLHVGGVSVSLECTADHLRGLVIQDHKTKFSPADPRDYEASAQWRVYLLVHGARVFRYNLWSFADPKAGYCELHGVTAFNFWRYANLEGDVRRWLAHFLEWAGDRSLLRYLERDPYREAA